MLFPLYLRVRYLSSVDDPHIFYDTTTRSLLALCRSSRSEPVLVLFPELLRELFVHPANDELSAMNLNACSAMVDQKLIKLR